MAIEGPETPQEQWGRVGEEDITAGAGVALPSAEPDGDRSSPAVDSTMSRLDDPRGGHHPSGTAPGFSDGDGLCAEEEDREGTAAVDEWLKRVCLTSDTGVQGPLETAAEADSSEILSQPEEASVEEDASVEDASDVEREGGEEETPKSPARARETVESIRAMREVAVICAQRAISLHSCQRLLRSSRWSLCLAVLAALVSFALQTGSADISTIRFALACIAFALGAGWTIQYLATTRNLSKQYRSAFGLQGRQRPNDKASGEEEGV
jgi:hypothetical protein